MAFFLQVPNKETRQLMCHHYTNNNHPLLIISPAKQEEIHLDTGLSFFHHVLTDGETELLQRLASQKVGIETLLNTGVFFPLNNWF